MRHTDRWIILGSSLAVCCSAVVFAGDITPPGGPVVGTMKTLDEVEPRIAINATNTPGDATNSFIISQPGSYYLTGEILGESGKSGIKIDAHEVTLNLSGFTLRGVAGSLNGIDMTVFKENVVISNGIVYGWGSNGINTRIDFGRIEKIIVSSNSGWGIDNGSNNTFTTRIIECEAYANGTTVASTGGIRGGGYTIVRGCYVFANTGAGIDLGSNGAALDNVCQASITDATLGSTGFGIRALGSNSTIDGNKVIDCPTGIIAGGDSHVIIRNSVIGASGLTYNFGGIHDFGPVGAAATSTSPWANLVN